MGSRTRGLSFFFVARPEFKKAQTEKGWVRTGGKGADLEIFLFPGSLVTESHRRSPFYQKDPVDQPDLR